MSLVTAGVMGWRHGGCRGGGAAWGEGSVRRRGGGGDEEHVSRSSIPYEDLAARPPPPRAAVAPCSVPFALTRGWKLRAGACNQAFCRVRLLVWLSLCFWVQIFMTMIIRLRNFEMDTLCGGQCELIIIIIFFNWNSQQKSPFLEHAPDLISLFKPAHIESRSFGTYGVWLLSQKKTKSKTNVCTNLSRTFPYVYPPSASVRKAAVAS